jgi:hypothetical protein
VNANDVAWKPLSGVTVATSNPDDEP